MADTNTPLQWLAEVEAECRREHDELRAEVERLKVAVLAYDDVLDELYAAMIVAAGRDPEL